MSQGEKYRKTKSSECFSLCGMVHKAALLINKIQRMANLFFFLFFPSFFPLFFFLIFIFKERDYTLFQTMYFRVPIQTGDKRYRKLLCFTKGQFAFRKTLLNTTFNLIGNKDSLAA